MAARLLADEITGAFADVALETMNIETIYRAVPAWLQTVLLNTHAFRIDRHRFGAGHRRLADELMRSEGWDRHCTRKYQSTRLRSIVEVAYRRSGYYREVMDRAGIRPAAIRGIGDLHRLPLLEKETVRTRTEQILTGRPRSDWLHGHTSGTTGSPLSLWYDRDTCLWTNAVDRRHKRGAGIADDEWIGVFLGRVIVSPRQRRPPFWRVNRVHRQVWFSTFHMSDTMLCHYVREIRRRGLRFLEGYPSTLYILADYLLRHGDSLPLKAAITSSETLHPIQRDRIEAAFECRLFDFYALAERVAYAGECEAHEGKHIAEEYSYVEVVDERGTPVPDGEEGYLVGTSLINRAMPLIRYRTGDVTSILPKACPCGRTHRRIADVATKAEDIVVTPDGRYLSPSILTHPFKPFDQIVKSQIVQTQGDQIEVKIVAASEFSAGQRAELLAGLRERLGPTMTVELIEVDDIPREASGKYRWVVSRIASPVSVSWGSR